MTSPDLAYLSSPRHMSLSFGLLGFDASKFSSLRTRLSVDKILPVFIIKFKLLHVAYENTTHPLENLGGFSLLNKKEPDKKGIL